MHKLICLNLLIPLAILIFNYQCYAMKPPSKSSGLDKGKETAVEPMDMQKETPADHHALEEEEYVFLRPEDYADADFVDVAKETAAEKKEFLQVCVDKEELNFYLRMSNQPEKHILLDYQWFYDGANVAKSRRLILYSTAYYNGERLNVQQMQAHHCFSVGTSSSSSSSAAANPTITNLPVPSIVIDDMADDLGEFPPILLQPHMFLLFSTRKLKKEGFFAPEKRVQLLKMESVGEREVKTHEDTIRFWQTQGEKGGRTEKEDGLKIEVFHSKDPADSRRPSLFLYSGGLCKARSFVDHRVEFPLWACPLKDGSEEQGCEKKHVFLVDHAVNGKIFELESDWLDNHFMYEEGGIISETQSIFWGTVRRHSYSQRSGAIENLFHCIYTSSGFEHWMRIVNANHWEPHDSPVAAKPAAAGPGDDAGGKDGDGMGEGRGDGGRKRKAEEEHRKEKKGEEKKTSQSGNQGEASSPTDAVGNKRQHRQLSLPRLGAPARACKSKGF